MAFEVICLLSEIQRSSASYSIIYDSSMCHLPPQQHIESSTSSMIYEISLTSSVTYNVFYILSDIQSYLPPLWHAKCPLPPQWHNECLLNDIYRDIDLLDDILSHLPPQLDADINCLLQYHIWLLDDKQHYLLPPLDSESCVSPVPCGRHHPPCWHRLLFYTTRMLIRFLLILLTSTLLFLLAAAHFTFPLSISTHLLTRFKIKPFQRVLHTQQQQNEPIAHLTPTFKMKIRKLNILGFY